MKRSGMKDVVNHEDVDVRPHSRRPQILLVSNRTVCAPRRTSAKPEKVDACHGPKRVATSRADRLKSCYLRAAQAYMLISMPTGTSTIFGAFQAIRVSQVT
jgi:hypothetical protein